MEKDVSKGQEYYLLGKVKLEKNTGDIQSLIELARQAGGLGEFEYSIELWQQVIALNPNNAEAFLDIGYSYLELGRYEEALAASQKAMTLDPNLKEAVLNYSICELAIGDVTKAIAALENLLTKVPEYPAAMGNLAVAYYIDNQRDMGLEYLDKIRKKGFNSTSTLCSHARRLTSVGRTDYAILLLEVALESNNVSKDVLLLLAECIGLRDNAGQIHEH
jgi:Flp pilus assembly protein TadD